MVCPAPEGVKDATTGGAARASHGDGITLGRQPRSALHQAAARRIATLGTGCH